MTNVGLPSDKVWSSVVQTDTYVLEPGDGDVYRLSARVLFDDEAKAYNATPGDVMVQLEYERRWLVLPIAQVGVLAWSYIVEKAHNQGFARDGMQRHVIAFHHIACAIAERESWNNPMSLSQMGWSHDRFRLVIAAIKQDIESIRRDAEVV